jgi:hypothetical protein
MRKRILGVLLTAAVFSAMGSGETVTLRNNAEINCRLSYQDGTFTLVARYPKGTKTFKFDRAEVGTIEINKRDFNPGEPPKDFTVFDARSSTARDASMGNPAQAKKKDQAPPKHSVLDSEEFNPSTEDVFWLQNKTKITGHLLKVDSKQITIGEGKERHQLQIDDVATVLVAPN